MATFGSLPQQLTGSPIENRERLAQCRRLGDYCGGLVEVLSEMSMKCNHVIGVLPATDGRPIATAQSGVTRPAVPTHSEGCSLQGRLPR